MSNLKIKFSLRFVSRSAHSIGKTATSARRGLEFTKLYIKNAIYELCIVFVKQVLTMKVYLVNNVLNTICGEKLYFYKFLDLLHVSITMCNGSS